MVIPVMFIYRLHAAADRAAGARTAAHAGPGAFGLLWAGAWLLETSVVVVQPETAFAVLVVVMVVFAIGQCLHGAVAAPLATDLAEPRLMGRYMALNALSWQIGFALGPALGGAGLAVSPNGSGWRPPRCARSGLRARWSWRARFRFERVAHRYRQQSRLEQAGTRATIKTWR